MAEYFKSDFACMAETVRRRYSRLKREKKPLPNLILIDGKGQDDDRGLGGAQNGGDGRGRFLVVQEELAQSIRIVRQCLPVIQKTEGEPVDVSDPKVRWPAKDRVFGRMEELIQQFKGVTEGVKPPPGSLNRA